MSVVAVRSPAEYESRLERFLFERSEEARAVRVGEKEISEQAAIVARYRDLFTREQIVALAEAEQGGGGDERERRGAVEDDARPERPHRDLAPPLPPQPEEDDRDHDEEGDPEGVEDEVETDRAGLARSRDRGRHRGDDEEAAERPVRARVPVGHPDVV